MKPSILVLVPAVLVVSLVKAEDVQDYRIAPNFKPGDTVYCGEGFFGVSSVSHLQELREAQDSGDVATMVQTIDWMVKNKAAASVHEGSKGVVLKVIRDNDEYANLGALVEVKLENQDLPIWTELGHLSYHPQGSAEDKADKDRATDAIRNNVGNDSNNDHPNDNATKGNHHKPHGKSSDK
jgi:hypothetical protein